MPDSPLDPAFWEEADEILWAALGPLIFDNLSAAAEAGAAALPAGVDSLISWEGFNQAALDFVSGYRFEWIRGITDTTRSQTQHAVTSWITSGEPLDVLESRLGLIFGEARAASIAATEVTRIYQEGNELAWKSTGLVEKAVWRTVNDERVCPICEPLDGEEIDLGSGPPAHINCRCYTEPIVSEELLERELEQILS
jgi:SPP1 gp7 family putative phage head morphogenesis protein